MKTKLIVSVLIILFAVTFATIYCFGQINKNSTDMGSLFMELWNSPTSYIIGIHDGVMTLDYHISNSNKSNHMATLKNGMLYIESKIDGKLFKTFIIKTNNIKFISITENKIIVYI